MRTVIRKLDSIVKEFYEKGLEDENFVMEATEKTFGGRCYKASKNEDMYDHIDFFWDSPKKGRLSVDVKGMKKSKRSDKFYDDSVHWLELQNVVRKTSDGLRERLTISHLGQETRYFS